MLLDGSQWKGRLPCLFCRHAKRRKTEAEWRQICGRCRGLTSDEVSILHWYQEKEGEQVVVAPNMLRHSRENSDARYEAARAALNEWHVPENARLLDVGCGISAQAAMFSGFHYVGADLDRFRLGRALWSNPRAAYAVQDVTRMGWRNGAFDALLCLEVIEHIPPAGRLDLMRELFRVLRPGGLLLLSTPNGRMTGWKRVLGRKCERSHEPELSPAEVASLVERAGGALHRQEPLDNLIMPVGWIAAGIVHLVAGRRKYRRGLRELASAAGYETILYVATVAASQPAPGLALTQAQ